jgi:hypothetical protein
MNKKYQLNTILIKRKLTVTSNIGLNNYIFAVNVHTLIDL